MVQSIFDVFKTSLGPSSSHTTGPMLAARDFVLRIEEKQRIEQVQEITITLHGSLAATGIGHSTDKALLLGLLGYCPESINPYEIETHLSEIESSKTLKLLGKHSIDFKKNEHMFFKAREALKFHPNGLHFTSFDQEGKILAEEVYYSIGGGKILLDSEKNKKKTQEDEIKVPYPFTFAKELQNLCQKQNLSISELTLENEGFLMPKAEVYKKLDAIQDTMEDCIIKGCQETGILPGILKVKRRAHGLYKKLLEREKNCDHRDDDPTLVLDWINLYALAVNEENASGSKIITAPTNGAAGVIPAVLSYYKKHTKKPTKEGCYQFLLVAGAVGILYMNRASISGAEVGCQGEVGVACSMAAAGLVAALGGSNIQIEKAAEIGMEHNLGLTCDPVGGLVQIPCIERNAMASIKALNASRLALVNDEVSHVSLDQVIQTMYQTGLDMKTSYKETSEGGLAVNVTNC